MKFKWEPVALMVLLMGLGVWLVWNSKNTLTGIKTEPGSRTVELRVGNSRGVIELPKDGASARVLLRDGYVSERIEPSEFRRLIGERASAQLLQQPPNALFRLFNITTWSSLIWVTVGLGGQCAFFGRMLIQWLISEKSRESIVPAAFWWLSLIGGVALFAYFVWRQDFVGVLGQSSGVVIYARNLRLIAKRRSNAARMQSNPTG